MSGIRTFNLQDLVDAIGSQRVQVMLDEYSCPLNHDIEEFLQKRAVGFAAQGIAQTHLVFHTEDEGVLLIGFYSLTNKVLSVNRDDVSKTMFKRFRRFGLCDEDAGTVYLAVPLIAQLGKNYAGGCDLLISGDELLRLACERVSDLQHDLGGKLVYLECEDTPALVRFYEDNGFKRVNPSDGTGNLLQYIRQS